MPCLLNIIHLLFQNGEFSHPKWSQNIAKIRVDRIPFSTWSKSIHLENSGKKWFLSNVSSTFFSKINVIQLGIERYPINTNFCMVEVLDEIYIMCNTQSLMWAPYGPERRVTEREAPLPLLERSQALMLLKMSFASTCLLSVDAPIWSEMRHNHKVVFFFEFWILNFALGVYLST